MEKKGKKCEIRICHEVFDIRDNINNKKIYEAQKKKKENAVISENSMSCFMFISYIYR